MYDIYDNEKLLLKKLNADASDLFKSLSEYENYILTNGIYKKDTKIYNDKTKENYKLLIQCLNYINNINKNGQNILSSTR